MKELLTCLKEACENEIPITLSSLINTLKTIKEFEHAHIYCNRKEYIKLTYFDDYYGSLISFYPREGNTKDYDDVAIYFIPYNKELTNNEKININDQIMIIGIECNKGGPYDIRVFVELAQNKKYIYSAFKDIEHVEVEEFAKLCKEAIYKYDRR